MARYNIVVAVLVLGVVGARGSSEAMRHIATGFIRVLDECKQELGLTDHILTDMYHFWKLDYSMMTRETGCAIICMSKKLDLIDGDGKLHHGNAQAYALKHGAATEVAAKLVEVIHGCEKLHESIDDQCSRVLEVAKCFRTGVHELHWAPKLDVIVGEVMTEI
ncbi:pheromone binding protein 3 precursor [Bombyx mori]|uniref:Pheromone binding protein 3 n=2 Tax=Bombyx TaxID=7090 RepID=A4F5B9_BOMMO|nr:pheromone binding protein 3 precursor [Bombyx mori]ACW84370.1 pheromone-binding protein 3 [Bombyx mandarina]CAL47309.1 pheromone binding protein 3 [Bombyx mori]